MKIFFIHGDRAHWHTPYKSLEEVPEHPPTDLYVEAPDEVQEGWIYLGDGKFRSDEPERLQAEIDTIDGQLRDMYKESLFQNWLKMQIAGSGAGAAMPTGKEGLEAWPAAYNSIISSFDDETGVVSSTVFELVKAKNELVQKLKGFEPEIVSL